MDRHCFTSNKVPKKRYATRAAAKQAVRDRGYEGQWSIYRCPSCDWFHVGHYPTSERGRARLRNRHRAVATALAG